MLDKITQALDDNQYAIGLFLDLSKAFDCINHKILLMKLDHYGVGGQALKWFKSYLSDRYQYVVINETTSNKMKINTGVPQGSLLGPLLFLLAVNDIVNSTKLLYYVLFADDSNAINSHENLRELISTTNNELINLGIWFLSNFIS